MSNANESAFPSQHMSSTGEPWEPSNGLTKRELFAIEIMAGQAASEGNNGEFWSDDNAMARRAVSRAGALLAELAKVQS